MHDVIPSVSMQAIERSSSSSSSSSFPSTIEMRRDLGVLYTNINDFERGAEIFKALYTGSYGGPPDLISLLYYG